VTWRPAEAKAEMADSRPDPGPCTKILTLLMPSAIASLPHSSAAIVAAKGVDFFDPLNPALPELPQTIVLPILSVTVIRVLLKVALMCATPSASITFFAAFLDIFFVATLYRPQDFSTYTLGGFLE
tara:strand:+ start:1147 stop:1524 length:378 start_codon:yes stop_codon:yes gene_type:complete